MSSMYSKGGESSERLPPSDSATVILMREREAGPYEIFLMRRHHRQTFMGGAFVFPGGKLDEEDCDAALLQYAGGFSAQPAKERLQEPGFPDGRAVGIFFAALRETFEEAGVLLARTSSGKPVDFADDKTAGRFGEYRLNIYKKELSLKKLAQIENLSYAPDMLTPYSRWITPQTEPKRFDTRFLLARAPEGQSPVHCDIEMTESMWITPAAALDRHKSGKITLMPPTFKTIEELNEFDSIDQLLTVAKSRDIYPILPQAFKVEGGFGVKLPHDPEYSIDDYKQPPRPDEPSRIVLQSGKWKIIKPQ